MSATPAVDPTAGRYADSLLAKCQFPGPAHGAFTLAVSGGADSLALLVLAARHGLDATAVHVDHGLRAGSSAEAEVVSAAADRFGLAFEARCVQLADGPDLEERAREARYGVLPRGVLTGHTMDDQAETVLLNVLRGAALDGLAGMSHDGESHDAMSHDGTADDGMAVGDLSPPRVRRPLLRLRRAETTRLCQLAGLAPVTDLSNLDPRFRRNRIRREVLPLLCDVAQRDVVPVLARQAELLSGDRQLLDALAAHLDPTDSRALREAPVPLASRAVRSWLRSQRGWEGHPPSLAEVRRVLEVASGAVRACELEGGLRVERSAGRMRLVDPATVAEEATVRTAEPPIPGSGGATGRVGAR